MKAWQKRLLDPEHVQCDWCARLAVDELTFRGAINGHGLERTIQACADHREQYHSAVDRHHAEMADRELHPEEYPGPPAAL